MKNSFKNTLLGLLLPILLCVLTYSQNQGYFASNYTVLAQIFCGLLGIHIALFVLGVSYRVIWPVYIGLIIPLGHLGLWIDTLCRILGIGISYYALKKIPTKPLCLGIGILLAFNSYNLIQKDYQARKEASALISKCSSASILTPTENIYWVVCDAYTSKEVLKTYYQFDNTDFYKELETLGFATPDGQTPYYPTLKAINTYLQPLEWDPTTFSSLSLHYTLQKAPLLKNLKNQGYTLHILEPRFPFLQNLPEFEPLDPRPKTSLLEFLYACVYRSKLISQPLVHCLNKHLFDRQEQIEIALGNLSSNRGRHFYYLHFDLPHAPFIFNQAGEFYNDTSAFIWGENEVSAHTYKKEDYCPRYLDQIQGFTPKILSYLKAIIQKDPKAMILLQGDHGTFTTQDSLENQGILFAVRNPLKPLSPGFEAHTFLRQCLYGN